MTDRRSAADRELDQDAARLRQRLRALRTRYPGVALVTQLTHIHDDQAVIQAVVTLPDGTAVSAHAAEPMDANGLLDMAIEFASQRAITRAFDLLGVGDVPAGNRVERAPAESAAPPVVDALRKASQPRTVVVADAAPTVAALEKAEAEPLPDDDEMADYGWTDFWKWARANNLNAKGQVEQRIGRSMEGLQPREVRQLLFAAGVSR